MLNVLLLLLFINLHVSAQSEGPSRLIIENALDIHVDQKLLNKHFIRAYNYFEKEIGPLNQDITVSIGEANCLRTGFNFIQNKVNFCSNQRVKDHGLKSIDVINHELFHAFLCQYKSELCGPGMRADVHEALADYFSYLLSPDEFFGEDFYQDQSFVRRYKTYWRAGLVQGEHSRGNALASQLIKNRISLKESLALFNVPVIEEVTDKVTGVPKSHLNRYRLDSNEVMQIEFNFSPEVQVSQVIWQNIPGISIERVSEKIFSIKVTAKPASPKLIVRFLSSDGQELGQRVYYFGSKH